MPAVRKAPSCREKCMTSLRGTCLLVISSWRTLLFSEAETTCRARSVSAAPRARLLSAASTPVTSAPSGVSAV